MCGGGGEVDTTGVTAPFSADMRSGFLLLLVWGGGGTRGRREEVDTTGVTAPFSDDMRSFCFVVTCCCCYLWSCLCCYCSGWLCCVVLFYRHGRGTPGPFFLLVVASGAGNVGFSAERF